MPLYQFDAETREAFRKIGELVDILGIKSVEELSDTQIVDKDGVVYDLGELVKTKCVIDTGVCLHMAIDDYYSLNRYWVSQGGIEQSSESLAKLLREHSDELDCTITVHKF